MQSDGSRVVHCGQTNLTLRLFHLLQSDGFRVAHCTQTALTLRLFHLLQSDGSAGLPGPLLGGVQHNMLSDPVLCRFFLRTSPSQS